ncbi:MAG: sigma-70 family RNA polymerase sigma factor [Myxococcales bacterium]|nr:sigma-70 family RNA polymerase sigma factor [Myxococcales bacterium]
MDHLLGEATRSAGDAELIARAASGDRAAFTELVERHRAAVHRYARSLTKNDADAEDALQRTFLAVWRSAATFRGPASARSWLFTVARNAALRQARPRREDATEPEALAELGARAGWGTDSPHALLEGAEVRARLGAALARLDADDREVIVLRDLEGLSGDEASSVLGLSLSALKSRLHRARLRLMASLQEEIR